MGGSAFCHYWAPLDAAVDAAVMVAMHVVPVLGDSQLLDQPAEVVPNKSWCGQFIQAQSLGRAMAVCQPLCIPADGEYAAQALDQTQGPHHRMQSVPPLGQGDSYWQQLLPCMGSLVQLVPSHSVSGELWVNLLERDLSRLELWPPSMLPLPLGSWLVKLGGAGAATLLNSGCTVSGGGLRSRQGEWKAALKFHAASSAAVSPCGIDKQTPGDARLSKVMTL